MSASNWANCPRCNRRAQREAERLNKVASESYGLVTAMEWNQMVEDANSASVYTPDANLREDYEIYGAEDGSIIVSYSAQCGDCGLSLSFKHEEVFDGVDD